MLRHALLSFSFLSVSAVALVAVCVSVSAAESNIVLNPGFEKTLDSGKIAGWTAEGPAGEFRLVDEARNGGKCIRLSLDKPTDTALSLTQILRIEPCKKYSLSIWVRNKTVESKAEAGTVCIEWLKDGVVFLRTTPPGPKGTGDWRRWDVGTYSAAAQADSARIKLLVTKGTSGTIWWDDINFSPIKDPKFDCTLIEPNYRGWMYGSYPASIKAVAKVNCSEYGLNAKDLKINMKLLNAGDGKVIHAESLGVRGADDIISMKKPALSPGNYKIDVSLTNAGTGERLGSFSYPIIQKSSQTPDERCWIDSHGRLIVNGQPFFPLGLYMYTKDSADDLKIIADGGFNTVMPYVLYQKTFNEQMAWLKTANDLGVKTIYSVKDFFKEMSYWSSVNGKNGFSGDEEMVAGYINTLKDNPGIIAWYLSDEPGPEHATSLEKHYNIAREIDPNHPCWFVLFKPEDLRSFASSFDTYGTDNYPISWAPIDLVGATANTARQQIHASRPAWSVPQICNMEIYAPNATESRPPTYEEMRNMAYQCLCAGANGLIFYMYDDVYRDPDATSDQRWSAVKKLTAEFRPMMPKLLSVDKPVSLKVNGKSVSYFSKKYSGKTYLYLVNTTGQPSTATVTLPKSSFVVKVNGSTITPDRNRQFGVPLSPLGIAEVEVQEQQGK